MLTLSLSSSSSHPFSLYNKQFHHSLKTPSHRNSLLRLNQHRSSDFCFNPLKVSINSRELMNTKRRGLGTFCYSATLTPSTLQWICTVSSAVLMLSRGTAIQKPFLVPLFALQAPASIISWIKGEYGIWTAFLALLVRLFFFIPGELELPFVALLLVIVAPYQVMNLRGTQEGVMLSLLIAGYLAFQHFSRLGSLQKAFEQGSIVATLSILCATVATCLLLV